MGRERETRRRAPRDGKVEGARARALGGVVDVLIAAAAGHDARKVELGAVAALPVHLPVDGARVARIEAAVLQVRRVARLLVLARLALGLHLEPLLEELHLLQRAQPTTTRSAAHRLRLREGRR